MAWLGLDIGGANLKAAHASDFTRSLPFPLWRQPEMLTAALGSLLAEAPTCAGWAVTMTGELCDCFPTIAEGVLRSLDAVESAAGTRSVRIYLTDGRLATLDSARREPLLVAASNWHALARCAARYVPQGPALLLDVGSTTTDVIPIVAGRLAHTASRDTERLIAGELVYTGVVRSPLCAVAASVPYRGRMCPTAQEFFATMADAYLVLGDLPEQPTVTDTADGRPATRSAARSRLARSICTDATEFDDSDALAVARAARQAQIARIAAAVTQVQRGVAGPLEAVVVSGQGEFLARQVVERLPHRPRLISLAEALGADRSRVAPAWAVATLADEEFAS